MTAFSDRKLKLILFEQVEKENVITKYQKHSPPDEVKFFMIYDSFLSNKDMHLTLFS